MNKKAEVNNGDAIDVDFLMNDTEASKEWADAILKQQPEKIENQGKLIREVLNNGTEEQKQVMYDIVNNMPEIVDLYNRINSDKKESSWDWNVEMAAAA
jgi:1,2-phenylacetyl-CoA epoxidase catalytic subunit